MKDLSEADPRLLVGFESSDDAGVVRLDAERALVQTTDFFTPVVDDPYEYGAIAAANALSDVYAMGGTPLSALNIVCFPDKDLPVEVLVAILRGGKDKVAESGAVLAGGHSVRDKEIKYGLAVTGLVHPDRVWTNRGAVPGDVLVLTKALGTGILATARKRDVIDEAAMAQAKASMARLNADGRDSALDMTVHACTDVTGFGLAGHAWEMARSAGVGLRLQFDALPLLDQAMALAEAGHSPGGAKNNRRHLGASLVSSLPDAAVMMAADPQTSGGLLLAVPAGEADALVARLHAAGSVGARVGEIVEGPARVELI